MEQHDDIKFNESEIKQIKTALEYFHEADLSDYEDENIKALESVMKKLNMDFISWNEY